MYVHVCMDTIHCDVREGNLAGSRAAEQARRVLGTIFMSIVSTSQCIVSIHTCTYIYIYIYLHIYIYMYTHTCICL